MSLTLLGILVGVVFFVLNGLLTRRPEQSADGRGPLPQWHSDYKQLRIEYHHSIDESLSPPKR